MHYDSTFSFALVIHAACFSHACTIMVCIILQLEWLMFTL